MREVENSSKKYPHFPVVQHLASFIFPRSLEVEKKPVLRLVKILYIIGLISVLAQSIGFSYIGYISREPVKVVLICKNKQEIFPGITSQLPPVERSFVVRDKANYQKVDTPKLEEICGVCTGKTEIGTGLFDTISIPRCTEEETRNFPQNVYRVETTYTRSFSNLIIIGITIFFVEFLLAVGFYRLLLYIFLGARINK